jgi:hypothetical protein
LPGRGNFSGDRVGTGARGIQLLRDMRGNGLAENPSEVTDWLMDGSSFAWGSIGAASGAFKLHAWKRRIYLGWVRGDRQPHLRSMRIAAAGAGKAKMLRERRRPRCLKCAPVSLAREWLGALTARSGKKTA